MASHPPFKVMYCGGIGVGGGPGTSKVSKHVDLFTWRPWVSSREAAEKLETLE
jgi:hypothetical protein